MATRIHKALNLSEKELTKLGIFDGFIDIDNKFYIDPHLIEETQIPEFSTAYHNFQNYFDDIIKILSHSKTQNDIFFKEAVKKLTFREIPYLSLGYSIEDNSGSGIGKKIATNLAKTAIAIINAGIKDSTIFELIGLIEEGVGADRISDMTARIIYPNILEFNQNLSKKIGLKTSVITYKGTNYSVPASDDFGSIILLPDAILRALPVALDWSDIDIIASHNTQLRMKVNNIIGSTWKDATKTIKKKDLRRIILSNPELLRDLIEIYKGKDSDSYDFKNDPLGMIIWQEIAKNFASDHPLSINNTISSPNDVLNIVRIICNKYKYLIENNGLNKLLYDDKGKRRHEKFAQLLFYGIAESYCETNNIDLSPETNSGRGPVDFKISKGFSAKVNIEVKYTSSQKLVQGYETQLPIYNKQEKTNYSIYLIIETSNTSTALKRIYKLNNKLRSQGNRIPEIITVDAKIKPSASNA